MNIKSLLLLSSVAMLAGCTDATYLEKESPNKLYKDYTGETAHVLGVGEPITKRQMQANATLKLQGRMPLSDVMHRVAMTYNLAVRYSDGVREEKTKEILIAQLTFDEARNYIEDVYDVQIVREGERRLLVLPSINESRVDTFNPGVNVSLSQVVRGLAKQCDYNVVITENKKALSSTFVTTMLEDITCLDAFDALLTPHGLALLNEGDHYTIGGFPTKQWRLDLYEPLREETQSINYSSSISGEEDEGGAIAASGGSGQVITTNSRNLWKELGVDLTDLIERTCSELKDNHSFANDDNTVNSAEIEASASGDDDCGYVRINPNVGLVQMRAPQSVLNAADDIIRKVEDIASRRLLVEARIIAVTKKHGFERGNQVAASDSDNEFNAVLRGDNVNVSAQLTNALLGFTETSAYGGAFQTRINNIDAAVRLAESFGTTYQLMQPTMEVMDRQRGVMIDGRNEKYFIIEREEETTDLGTEETITAEEKTQFVGIQFSVTAQVADEGEPHTLAIQVPMTEIDRFVTIPDESNSQVPVVTTRVIDQKVRIRDGEVKVIGGLTRTIAVDNESGVPLLRQMPVAGHLMGDESISYENVEFIVLLQVRRVY